MRWGMVIDLTRCARCFSCVAACRLEHFLPPDMSWPRLMAFEQGEYPDMVVSTYPVRCNECADPSCIDVCPTGANQQREDGIVWIDQNKCVGCRYCIIACPYQARTYLAKEKEYFPGHGLTDFEKAGKQLYSHQAGTTEKCNFCMERIDAGLAKGLKPGVDREATPACVNACPGQIMTFGDLDDPYSNVSILIREKNAVPLHPEFGTNPSIYFIDGHIGYGERNVGDSQIGERVNK